MRIEDLGARIEEHSAAPLLAPRSTALDPALKFLGLTDYVPTWQAMQQFTATRTPGTRDEIWLLQHPPVYTQGLAGKPEHLLRATDIPVVKIDRGGQITYHGPGQIVAYLLLDMRRWKLNVRELVRLMEQAVIDLLAEHGVAAQGREDAPGVYVADAKIASLGLKIKNGYCYHGVALNVDMDLTPFANINPCGYAGLRVTQARDVGINTSMDKLEQHLAQNLVSLLQRHLHGKMSTAIPTNVGIGGN
ncbi:lipoyl(octanoyl) transferase [Rhodocyclaceae bacterium]|nr:lipoyl(octanoyl) transferase [Rhodocyclaceae bacterium]